MKPNCLVNSILSNELPTSSKTNLSPLVLQAPQIESKELPKSLKYTFLGDNDTLSVIVSNKEGEEKTVADINEEKVNPGERTKHEGKKKNGQTKLKTKIPSDKFKRKKEVLQRNIKNLHSSTISIKEILSWCLPRFL